ncbi:MAG: carbohydrate binding family 9 domain-containing protein [Myxococcaceae bacterium]|nr:carbohydrate binding family 9 domain-containing protein [Myxococcaceae bacterium]MCI0670494.1 carbohydrate binding family 9 domain-containing protein [Myxococcaceae bacterium]
MRNWWGAGVTAGGLLALLVSGEARADGAFKAVRTSAPPELDGRLDDAAWKDAPVFDAFTQSFPKEGNAPSERTEVRVVYDDRALYVAVRSFDGQPASIARGQGRRDNPPGSDLVTVVVDPDRTRRTGYAFTVNAGGTLRDELYYADTQNNPDWDAVWDARAVVGEDGWSAEFVLPLDVLRFSSDGTQAWGLHVRRELRRTQETLDSAVMPVTANAFVSRFAALEGLVGLQPPRMLQLQPYLAGRTVMRPRQTVGAGTLALPSADVGLDVRASLTSRLSLNATFNPDFGQVEADDVRLNLGNSELFFPEKRPFFNEGMDLFAAPETHFGEQPHILFYSRRVGLDAPILGAAKLVGKVAEGLEVGILDAVVTGAANPSGESEEDGRVQFHPLRPLHVGPNSDLPASQPFARNFLVATARKQLPGNSTVRATLTDVTPLSRRCSPTVLEAGEEDCDEAVGSAGSVDFSVVTEDREWEVRGQLSGSLRRGGAPAKTLRDGTVLDDGDMGWATWVNAGKMGGEPWRTAVYFFHTSPTFDINGPGYLYNQNVQGVLADVGWRRSEALGPFSKSEAGLYVVRRFSADGRGLGAGSDVGLWGNTRLPNATVMWFNFVAKDPELDLWEIGGAGIPYQKTPFVDANIGAETDASRPFSGWFEVGGYRFLQSVLRSHTAYYSGAGATWRPVPKLETKLSVNLSRQVRPARYLERTADDTLLFGALSAPQLSVTLKQQVVFSPTLTLQGYAQLFGARGSYGQLYGARAPTYGTPVRMTDLTRVDADPSAYDFEAGALNLNLVMRWEYRLGSTLYAVYTHSQKNDEDAPLTRGVIPASLFKGPSTDVFMLKWTYLWDASV